MVKLGVVLILLSFALLFGLFLVPDLLMPLTPLYCPAGETLTRSTFTFATPGETSITLYFHCTDAKGVEQLDVSGQITWSIIGVFLLSELGGFALTSIGGRRKIHRVDGISEDSTHKSKRLKPGKRGNKLTLSERLRQLQEARQQGLIDSDEYGRLREEALDKLE